MASRDRRGQGLAEYALIIALVALLSVTALVLFSGHLDTILSVISASI